MVRSVSTAKALADDEIEELNARAFDEAGVDLTQIDLMLSLTPGQRLAMPYETATSLARLAPNADTD